MMTTGTTEIDLIPQRHKYTQQAPVWYALHLFHPQKWWKAQKCDETGSQALAN